MTITGTITNVLPMRTGISKAGNQWSSQEYIITNDDPEHPKQVCVEAKGDKIAQFALQMGERVALDINIDSREYNGRWYTSVTIWRATRI